MSEDILKKIIDSKIKRLENWKKTISTEKLHEDLYHYENGMNLKFYNFKKKIQNNLDKNKISIIGEIKCASPSAGYIIKPMYHAQDFAKMYNYKPLEWASKITVPILIVDVDKEELFDINKNGKAVYEIVKNKVKAEYKVFSGSHYDIYYKHFNDSIKLAIDWFTEHLLY